MNLSSCGIDCDVCRFMTEQNCPGCGALKGKPHWSKEEACDLYACAAEKKLPHCGKCGEFPCAMLYKWASAENVERIENLKKAGGTAMRVVFMAYITGTIEAVDFYCKAFNATSKNCFKASDDDGFYAHAEIVIGEQTVLALSEKSHYDKTFTNGDSMEFWMTFDDEQSLNKAYEVLKENAQIHQPLAPCEWCCLMAALTDKYGISWLINI